MTISNLISGVAWMSGVHGSDKQNPFGTYTQQTLFRIKSTFKYTPKLRFIFACWIMYDSGQPAVPQDNPFGGPPVTGFSFSSSAAGPTQSPPASPPFSFSVAPQNPPAFSFGNGLGSSSSTSQPQQNYNGPARAFSWDPKFGIQPPAPVSRKLKLDEPGKFLGPDENGNCMHSACPGGRCMYADQTKVFTEQRPGPENLWNEYLRSPQNYKFLRKTQNRTPQEVKTFQEQLKSGKIEWVDCGKFCYCSLGSFNEKSKMGCQHTGIWIDIPDPQRTFLSTKNAALFCNIFLFTQFHLVSIDDCF